MTDPANPSPIVLGWRERLALPRLGIAQLKVKLDTGARSSALHVESLETFLREGIMWLRFTVRAGRYPSDTVCCEAPALDRRMVTDTGGRRTERWFIRSEILLAGRRFEAEINLTDRRHMLFPMLLGRSALHGRFVVDPARAYTQPRLLPAATDRS
ncbi:MULTISPECIES: ATP-dependent zinc protease family protein [Rhodanobacter]|uniref:ATP-dependent zinc protease n=1 Tax=Rhodanobacter hydrolyticus TaxID=2250595 RepID=A0ABW8J9N9_9GAMM|nr:RimK/LysX family protein [Rhodanobacter sp. 7MK24]MBD8881139.1 ATP-dependent zinc protease [Rhodanobacter sp. 7MK24]